MIYFTKMSCNVCMEVYNKSSHKSVLCKCGFEVCRSCIKRYILGKLDDVCCMSCKMTWSTEFMVSNFEKVFISKDYKRHMGDVLFEKELLKLEQTQPYVEKQLKLEGMKKELSVLKLEYLDGMKKYDVDNECLNDRVMELTDLKVRIMCLNDDFDYVEMNDVDMILKLKGDIKDLICDLGVGKFAWVCKRAGCIGDLSFGLNCEMCGECDDSDVIKDIKLGLDMLNTHFLKKKLKLDEDIVVLDNCYISLTVIESRMTLLKKLIKDLESSEINTKVFSKRCPNSGCVGFLSMGLVCDLCGCVVCKDCEEMKGFDVLEHICDKSIVESVLMLKKETKECPVCRSLTYKSEGCDQIWCVKCRTTWDWVSRKIEKGRIHNPHYYEWQKTVLGVVPRNPMDVLCGRELDYNFMLNLDKKLRVVYNKRILSDGYIPYNKSSEYKFNLICLYMLDIREKYLVRYTIDNDTDDTLELRVLYMRKMLDDKNFKRRLLMYSKSKEIKSEFGVVLMTYVSCMTEIFYRMCDMDSDKLIGELGFYLKEMHNMRLYTNDCFKILSDRYNCVYPMVTRDFKFVH